jgi:cobalamin biosynthesis protein CbiG
MSRSVTILSALAVGLLSTSANAQSVAQLKAELAAEEAQVAKLKKRVRELEQSPLSLIQPAPIAAPVGVRAAPPPPSSPADDEEAERALERTLVREGALVLAPFTYEVTPQASVAHLG